jgi:hypothetical protein
MRIGKSGAVDVDPQDTARHKVTELRGNHPGAAAHFQDTPGFSQVNLIIKEPAQIQRPTGLLPEALVPKDGVFCAHK